MAWKVLWYKQAINCICLHNLDDLYVTANIDEKDIKDVEVGKDVDVTIDGQKLLLKVKLIVLEKLLLQAFH